MHQANAPKGNESLVSSSQDKTYETMRHRKAADTGSFIFSGRQCINSVRSTFAILFKFQECMYLYINTKLRLFSAKIFRMLLFEAVTINRKLEAFVNSAARVEGCSSEYQLVPLEHTIKQDKANILETLDIFVEECTQQN